MTWTSCVAATRSVTRCATPETISSWVEPNKGTKAGMVQKACVLGNTSGPPAWGPFWPISLTHREFRRHLAAQRGMVQKRPFSGNTRDLSADPDRSRVGAGLRESLVALLGLQFCENRVYPRSSSQ